MRGLNPLAYDSENTVQLIIALVVRATHIENIGPTSSAGKVICGGLV